MAESSSESDYFRQQDPLSRWSTRSTYRRTRNCPAADVTKKVNTITSTLQDTSRNLRQVDQMLGHYREYSNEQAGAIEQLKESLEQSIGQLRSQRLLRQSGGRSSSAASLSASDLDGGAAAESPRFPPTSPLKDYGDSQGSRTVKSRTSVRFAGETDDMGQLHVLHQSLRDLSSEQIRLGDDLSREFSRRSRSDAETKRTLEELTEKLNVQRQEVALKKQEKKAEDNEGAMNNKLRQTETEKSKLEQELELCRGLLNQSEGSRETLVCQIEELRAQLLKAEGDRKGLQHQMSQISRQQSNHQDEQADSWRFRRGVEREKPDLEKQMSDLRVQLSFNEMASELEEVKRSVGRKDKERARLAVEVENLTLELENREKQQLQMLDRLKEIQHHFQTCEAERQRADQQISELTHHAEDATRQAERYLSEFQQSEALREEAEKSREDLKRKAQESIKQWKLKHKKLERELEKQCEMLGELTDKNNQILKERDESKTQLYAALQQIENLRKELNDVLTKRALQEEELHCKEKKLSDAKCLQAELEQEVRESLDTVHRLENELKRQSKSHSVMKAEKSHLEEENAELRKSQSEDKAKLLELQESVKNLSAIRAELANKLAEEERAKKEVLKDLSDLKTHEKAREDETATIIRQLKLERDVHQRELEDLTASLQTVKAKHEQNIQELMRHFNTEKCEAENHIKTLKAESLEDKNTAKVHIWQLEKMKSQYDRMTQELAQNEEENKKLKLKYQRLKEQLEEKEKHISNEEENLRRMEEARLQLKDQLLCLETEQESIFGMIGKEIDAACKTFWKDSVDKLKVFSSVPDVHCDPHRWLAESKTKLQWLCEELRERESREKSLRHQLMLCRQQLKDLTDSKESELQYLFDQIERQEQLLEEIHQEKRDLLDENHRKDEEMESLQDRVMALETSTQVALDHLESVPEKLSLLDDFKDFRASCGFSKRTDGRYSKYKMQRESLQLRRDEAKYRHKSLADDKLAPESSHAHGLDHSFSWQDHGSFLSSPRFSHLNSFAKRAMSLDSVSIKEDPPGLTMSERSPQSKKEERQNKRSNI
ncbi:centrosomal protein of 128 kDa isoform X2 [Tenrec ecaudatus]|uniref:centrosomal protein of 128 kDa isoform X2 n=1 Tax=Tenrec ecaudatus TaxID=94439 RepID=UPI003F598C9A